MSLTHTEDWGRNLNSLISLWRHQGLKTDSTSPLRPREVDAPSTVWDTLTSGDQETSHSDPWKHLHRWRIQPRGCRFLKSCQGLGRQRTLTGQNKQKLFCCCFNFKSLPDSTLDSIFCLWRQGEGPCGNVTHGDVAGGTRFRGFLPVPGPRSGGPGSPCSFGCVGGHEAPLSSRDSAVKAALEPELLLFPQNGGSSTVFQNLPQSAQAPKHSAAGIYLTGFAATVQGTDFHWLKF